MLINNKDSVVKSKLIFYQIIKIKKLNKKYIKVNFNNIKNLQNYNNHKLINLFN